MTYNGEMQRILITTDFSHDSKYTIKYVLELLKNVSSPCNILLLNSYKVQQTDPNLVLSQNDDLKNNSHAKLLAEAVDMRKQITNPLLTVDIVSHMGSLRNVIYRIIQNEKIDLIAMGQDGGKNVEIIAKLLREEKKCPLLITYISK